MNRIDRNHSETARNIYAELSKSHVGALATIDHAGMPHLSVMYFKVNNDFTLHFATKRGTKKHANLTKKADVRVLIFDEKKQLTIQIEGAAHEVRDAAEEQRVIEHAYMLASENNFDAPPISKLQAGEYVAYKIKPARITMAMFTRPQRGGYDMLETLDFTA